MTSVLEKIITVIAPHRCIYCSKYNNIACANCLDKIVSFVRPCCAFCNKPSEQFATCKPCLTATSIQQVTVSSEYDGKLAELIKRFKFQRAQAAAGPLAQLIASVLPELHEDVVIVPIPTADTRIRQRGYDHALLLACELSKLVDRPYKQLLRRRSNARQVGADRRQRQVQANQAFELAEPTAQSILLLDDVITTGATLKAAANSFAQTGAKNIQAVVVARQPPPGKQM